MHEKNFECLIISIISGSCSGIIVKTISAPIDRIRMIYQVNKIKFTYKLAYLTAKRIVREEGAIALFRGNTASALRIVPYFGIQFWIHEQLKSALMIRTFEQKISNPCLNIISGSIASTIAIGITYPLDVARVRLATDSSYKSVYWVFYKAVRSKDSRYGLFRGFSAATLAIVPYSVISFHMYELVKMKYFPEAYDLTNKTWKIFITNLLLGSGITILGQTLVYPLDTVRRRMQVDKKREEQTFRQACISVWRLFGWKGYYKAITLSLVKIPFIFGVSIATFDYCYNKMTSINWIRMVPVKFKKKATNTYEISPQTTDINIQLKDIINDDEIAPIHNSDFKS